MAKKTFYGSLATRIFLSSLFLIVLPMGVYAFFSWDRDWHIRLSSSLARLEQIGQANQKIYSNWYETEVGSGEVTLSGNQVMFGQKSIPVQELEELFIGNVEIEQEAEGMSLSTVTQLKEHLSYKDLALLKENELRAWIPLKNASFDLVIKFPSEGMSHIQGSGIIAHLLLFSLCFIVLGTLGALWLVSRFSRPLHQLTRVMNQVESGQHSKRYHPDAYGFEINLLGEQFNQMLGRLFKSMQEAQSHLVAKEVLARELDIGHSVQKELLPKHIDAFLGMKVGGALIPAKQVGGDFYDLFPLDEERLFLTVADGSDKGVSACLYALIVRTLFRSFAMTEHDLKNIALMTNRLFCKDTGDTGNFVTAWMGIFHTKTKELTYTCLGHPPGLAIRSNGQLDELSTKGIALGVDEKMEVEVKSEKFGLEDSLFLYTDGILEAHNKKGELFEKSRLHAFLKEHHALFPQELINQLFESVDQFAQGIEQHDDLTALSLKV